MKIFYIFIKYIWRDYLESVDINFFCFFLFKNFLSIIFFFPLVTSVYLFLFLVVITEFNFFGFIFLISRKINLSFPYLHVHRPRSYFDFITNNFSISQGFESEGFLPPFVFGYRGYFFGRIVGWAGTWASYWGHTRRQVRSNIYDWGYKNMTPPEPSTKIVLDRLYLYKVPVMLPRTFRAVIGFSPESPQWFYSFPQGIITTLGFRDDLWDDDNYIEHPTYDEELHERASWRFIRRARRKYFPLYRWLDSWAPSLSPRDFKGTQFSAISLGSPYSYFNYPRVYFNSQYIDFQRGVNTGIEVKSVYTHAVEHNEINVPMLLKTYKLERNTNDPQMVARWIHLARQMDEDKLFRRINEEALKITTFSIAYRILKTAPYDQHSGSPFSYIDYFRLSVYHTLLEFSTILFESFSIYPFEIGFKPFDFSLDLGEMPAPNDSLQMAFSLYDIFELYLNSGFILVFVLFSLYFIFFLLFINFLKLALVVTKHFFDLVYMKHVYIHIINFYKQRINKLLCTV